MCSRAAASFSNGPVRFRAPHLPEVRAPARLLLVGSEAGRFADQWRKEEIDSTSCSGTSDLDALSQSGHAPRFDVAIWFYPPEAGIAEDTRVLDRLSNLADELVLLPAPGADVAKRRPQLVAHLGARGFFPNYECDIVEIEPGAVRLTQQKAETAEALVPAAEAGFARLNAQLRRLHRTLRTRMSELEAADRHIARLEEKVLKLKQAKRDLKQLKAENRRCGNHPSARSAR